MQGENSGPGPKANVKQDVNSTQIFMVCGGGVYQINSPAQSGLSCLLHPQRGWVQLLLLFTDFLFLTGLPA